MSQGIQIIPVEQGYQIAGFAQYGIADGTIIPYDYDPDADPNTTPQQKLIIGKILDRIESGGEPQVVQQQQSYEPQPAIPQQGYAPDMAQQIPYGAPVQYAQPQVGVSGVTGGDTSGYINQKARTFMNKRWSWLDNPPDVAGRAYSIYMRKQQHNARRMAKPRKKKKVKIPAMFRF